MEVTKDTIYVGHMSHGQRIAPNPKDAHPLKSLVIDTGDTSIFSPRLIQLLKMVIYSGFSHWKWWFSIAMLVYQRVYKWRWKNAN